MAPDADGFLLGGGLFARPLPAEGAAAHTVMDINRIIINLDILTKFAQMIEIGMDNTIRMKTVDKQALERVKNRWKRPERANTRTAARAFL